jgi:hypothetical protein
MSALRYPHCEVRPTDPSRAYTELQNAIGTAGEHRIQLKERLVHLLPQHMTSLERSSREKETAMAGNRNITNEDIFLKARLLSEGVVPKVKRPPGNWHSQSMVVFDGSGIVSMLRPNRYSRLEAVIEGEHVAISDMGEELGTATFEKHPDWFGLPLSNGNTVQSVFSGSTTITNIVLNFRCHNYDSGKGCKYCGLFAAARSIPAMSQSAARELTAYQVEAAVLAIQHGWRGTMVLTGGVLPPSKRGQLTEGIERVMVQFREALDSEALSQLHIAPNSYPPDDLSEMYRWRDLGVNSTEFDLEVMHPDYWKAICPGKSETYSQDYWKEAQVASAEIFGRGRGAVTAVVMGVEPMSSLVEGVEERISKGVYTTPLMFMPTPGSPYAEFRPPTAEWMVEASEKMADSYFRYADSLDVNLLTDNRPGFTRMGRSFFMTLVVDDMVRRLQEKGELPPGLPKQDGL